MRLFYVFFREYRSGSPLIAHFKSALEHLLTTIEIFEILIQIRRILLQLEQFAKESFMKDYDKGIARFLDIRRSSQH